MESELINRMGFFRRLFGIPLTKEELEENAEFIKRAEFRTKKRSVKAQMEELMKRIYLEEPSYYAMKKIFPEKEVMDLTFKDFSMMGFIFQDAIKLFYDNEFPEDTVKNRLLEMGIKHSELEILFHKYIIVGIENMKKTELIKLNKGMKTLPKVECSNPQDHKELLKRGKL